MKNKLIYFALLLLITIGFSSCSVLCNWFCSGGGGENENEHGAYLITKQEVMMIRDGNPDPNFVVKIYDITETGGNMPSHYVMVPAKNSAPSYPTIAGSTWFKGDRRCPPFCHVDAAQSAPAMPVPPGEQGNLNVNQNCLIVPADIVQELLNNPSLNYLSVNAIPGTTPKIMMIDEIRDAPERTRIPIIRQ